MTNIGVSGERVLVVDYEADIVARGLQPSRQHRVTDR
jgi:hypothetical protein